MEKQDWFIIDPKKWFLATFKTFEQKCDELLPIYKIEKEEQTKLCKEMQQRIDNWLLDEAEEILGKDRDNYFNEEIKEERAYKAALDKFINDFDKVDNDYQFIEINKEDELEVWQKEKDLILIYLKSL